MFCGKALYVLEIAFARKYEDVVGLFSLINDVISLV